MDRNEQVRLLLVGDRGASLQRNKRVVLAGVNDVGAQSGLQQLAQAAADIEHQILFLQAVGTDGAGIVSAVAGIDHDLADLQSQGADQRAVAAGGRRSFADIGKDVQRSCSCFGSEPWPALWAGQCAGTEAA